MNTSIKYIFTLILTLCVTCAEAQIANEPKAAYEHAIAMATLPTSSSAMVTEPMAQAPSFQYSNSMLDRRITIKTPQTASRNTNNVSGVITRRAGKSLGTGFRPGTVSPNPFISGHSNNYKGELTPAGQLPMGTEGSNGNGLNNGGGNRHPGELTPLGDALIPMLILLLCYALFLIVRGEAREDRKENEMA